MFQATDPNTTRHHPFHNYAVAQLADLIGDLDCDAPIAGYTRTLCA